MPYSELLNAVLIVLAPLLPLLFALVKSDRIGQWLLPLAVLPALTVSLWLEPGTSLNLPWLLMGAKWGVDATSQVFLLITAWLWFVAGLYSVNGTLAGSGLWRFRVFFMLTLSGNILLVLAQDMASFFLGFAAMGLAAYGLIVQQRSVTTTRAGRVYLVWAVLGEVILFAGMIMVLGTAGSHYFADVAGVELPLAAVLLVTVGLGIKLALPGLHVWLPIAHGAAPPAVSALLSGVMVKAGLLGLLRFLPAGTEHVAQVAEWLIPLGLFGAFYGVAVGVLQTAPKVVLAYSTMSQLGLMTMLTGIVLQQPQAQPALLFALVVYVAHHAWVKGALFIGVGVFKKTLSLWVILLLGMLALALAGLPYTSGALAKGSLKAALPATYAGLETWLLLSTFATTLLMGRFLWTLFEYRAHHAAPQSSDFRWLEWLSWGLLVETVLFWPVLFAALPFKWVDVLPIALGVTVAALLAWRVKIPAGDFPVLMAQAFYHLRKTFR